jgi:hypothetical protein
LRYFVCRQNGRPVAFSICTIEGDTICDDYIGNIVNWALGNDLKTYAST